MNYSFHLYNEFAIDGLTMAIDNLLSSPSLLKKQGAGTLESLPPVVVCVGSDLAIGDSLGPIAGSMLAYKTQGLPAFIYGTLPAPVTAKDVKYLRRFLRDTHPNRLIIAVDAAVGEKGDIGLIKCNDSPLAPGSGAGKKLGTVGDISIMGVVAEKSLTNYGLLNTTRLKLVYTMAEILSSALAGVLWEKYAFERNIGIGAEIG